MDKRDITCSITISNERYEVLENEKLYNTSKVGLTISGSLLKNSLFKNVEFTNCTFFGTAIEDCTFIGCNFNNCTFQFGQLKGNQFHSTTFKNCVWNTTAVDKGHFDNCLIDGKTMNAIGKLNNNLTSCFREEHTDFGALNAALAA